MNRKNNLLWNGIILLTIIGCIAALVLHYKNWVTFENDEFKITSGIYRESVPLREVNEVGFVPRIPELVRESGFSWLSREKGIFMDSITGARTYVFVDDLTQQKIHIQYQDSLQLFFNVSDSLKTQEIFTKILAFKNEPSQ